MKTFVVGYWKIENWHAFDNDLEIQLVKAIDWVSALHLAGLGWVLEGMEVVTIENVRTEAFNGDTSVEIKELVTDEFGDPKLMDVQ